MISSDVLDGIEADLAEGWGLPAATYRDDDWFELEHDAVFSRAWYYVGTTQHVPDIGDTMVGWAGRKPVVVVRSRDSGLRALLNICRHRGHPVCTRGASGLKALACPYHGWTYGLDGSLRGAPGSGGDKSFDKASMGMVELSLEMWGNQIFVSADPEPGGLRGAYPTLDRVAERRGFDHDPGRYKPHSRYESIARANWKLWYDNTIECYHCSLVHSDSFNAAYAADGDFETLIDDRLVSFEFPPRPKENTSELKVSFNRHVHLFPGFLCVQQDDVMIIGQMRPVSVTETAVAWDVLAEDGADPERVDAWARLWWDTFEEDRTAVEAVQRNVESGAQFRNRYVGDQEPVPVAVTGWIWDACAARLEEL